MDTTVLQQKLALQRHLLPSQQEFLNRLLFQLAFNDFQHIALVGAVGSGKSTLALALAELFSEQANVAMVNAPVTEPELEEQLLQHWFGRRQATPGLTELIAEPLAGALPLVLIVDNFDQLSDAARQKLLQLDCLGFFMLTQPSAAMPLNLSINAPTLQDAGHALKDKALDPLAVAERFAASAGNMHLFHSATVKPEERKSHYSFIWLVPLAIILLLLAVLIRGYLPTASDAPQRSDISAPQTVIVPNTEPAEGEAFTDPAERSDQIPVIMDSQALTDAAGLIDTAALLAPSLIKANAEPVAEPVPDAPTAVVNGSVTEKTAAAEPLYQEQQLLALEPDFRVLQLAVLSSDRALQRFVQTYPDTEITVYQRSWQGQLQWVVLTKDPYPDLSSARQARVGLAEPLRAAGPFIKPVAQVQQEIKALARTRAEPVLQE